MSQALVFDADATFNSPPANSVEFLGTDRWRKVGDQADLTEIVSPLLDTAPTDRGYFSLLLEEPGRSPVGVTPREWAVDVRLKSDVATVITPTCSVFETGPLEVVAFDTFDFNLGTDLQSFVFFGKAFTNPITDLTTLQVDRAFLTSVSATLTVAKVILLAPIYWTTVEPV